MCARLDADILLMFELFNLTCLVPMGLKQPSSFRRRVYIRTVYIVPRGCFYMFLLSISLLPGFLMYDLILSHSILVGTLIHPKFTPKK